MPFYAVLGNHDHAGSWRAQLDYAKQRVGSGRFRMDGQWYVRDFGRVRERVLARVVFLDSVSLKGQKPEEQIAYIRQAFDQPGSPIWRIVALHYACYSVTRRKFTREKTLDELRQLMRELSVDLYISANDQFQAMLRSPGEPLYVATNGGGDKLESDLPIVETPSKYVNPRPGFARVTVDQSTMVVELLDRRGEFSHETRLYR
jgi:tartrate-resistant acid phosphatase type 5